MDILRDALFGFFVTAAVLFLHAYMAITEYFHLITSVETALSVSLIQSIVLILIWLGVIGKYLYSEKRFGILVGSLLSFPFMYFLSDVVREGFAIFFAFI